MCALEAQSDADVLSMTFTVLTSKGQEMYVLSSDVRTMDKAGWVAVFADCR
jgi:hypothetical protein